MRILYINNGMGFATNVSLGGSDKRALEIAKRLSKKGIKIAFLVTSAGYNAFRKGGLNTQFFVIRPPSSIFVKMERLLLGRVISYIFSAFKSLMVLKAWFYKKDDIIYTTSDFLCDTVPAWILKKKPEIKWVAIIHHYIDVPWKRRGSLIINMLVYLSQQISFRLMRGADAILVYATPHGRRIKDILLEHGFPQRNIVEVFNGIDYRFITDIPEQEKIFDACFVGGLRPSKGIFDLVSIWKKICSEGKNSKLLIIGGGTMEYVNKIRSAIEREGLQENISLAGPLSGKELFRAIKSCKIFISPSYEEGWGIAVCEAMACGVPVIAYNLEAYDVFKEGIIRVPIGNIKSFTRSILGLLSDEVSARKLSEKAKIIARNFDWDRVAEMEYQFLMT